MSPRAWQNVWAFMVLVFSVLAGVFIPLKVMMMLVCVVFIIGLPTTWYYWFVWYPANREALEQHRGRHQNRH